VLCAARQAFGWIKLATAPRLRESVIFPIGETRNKWVKESVMLGFHEWKITLKQNGSMVWGIGFNSNKFPIEKIRAISGFVEATDEHRKTDEKNKRAELKEAEGKAGARIFHEALPWTEVRS